MDFALVRIDDRLIHGQVVLGWTRAKRIDTILAVDDVVAKDSFQCSLLQMATPPGVKSYIVSVQKALELINSGKLSSKKIMLLIKDPGTLLSLINQGFIVSEVNIGNVRSTPERKKYSSHIFATDDEIKIWKLLAQKTKLSAQILPDSPKLNFNEILDKVIL